MDAATEGRVEEDVSMHKTYAALAEDLCARATRESTQYWVAVAGCPAAGKSTLTSRVAEGVRSRGVSCTVIGMDGYHYYRSELDAMEDPVELHRRRGAHWTFNAERLIKDLRQARKRGHGSFPSFDHTEGDPREDDIELHADTQVVLVEGNYLLMYDIQPWGELQPLFDERWYIDCDLAEARERIIKRHIKTGRTPDDASFRADDNDIPNGLLIAEQSQKHATRVIKSI